MPVPQGGFGHPKFQYSAVFWVAGFSFHCLRLPPPPPGVNVVQTWKAAKIHNAKVEQRLRRLWRVDLGRENDYGRPACCRYLGVLQSEFEVTVTSDSDTVGTCERKQLWTWHVSSKTSQNGPHYSLKRTFAILLLDPFWNCGCHEVRWACH